MNTLALPLVYSCSGCSNVAQAANRAAVRLDRGRPGRDVCIVGVAAGVPLLVRIALSGRRMLVIDGCPLACCHVALAQRGVKPWGYIEFSQVGLRKRLHEDLTDEEFTSLWQGTILPALEEVNKES